jgi:hypothetical protein
MSEEKRKEDIGKVDREGFKAFEAALASLVPRADRLDRDRLMFLAGQQSTVGSAHYSSANESDSPLPLGEQSRVGQAQRSPTNYSEKPEGGTALRLSHPTAAWAWPAAFSAMTTVAAALAILLAIRPASPWAAGGGSSNIAGNESAPPAVQASNMNEPPTWIDVDREANEKLQPAPPVIALLQSVWKPGDAGNAAAEMPAWGEASLSYRALRDSILRRDSDSRKLAGVFPSRMPPDISAPPTSRGLLKEYLLDSK